MWAHLMCNTCGVRIVLVCCLITNMVLCVCGRASRELADWASAQCQQWPR